LAKAVLIRQQQRFQLAPAQFNFSIGHGTSPSTGIVIATSPPCHGRSPFRASAVLSPKLFAEPSGHYR
ncbi:hypothetical protein, partial [Mesorhizobium sp. M0220]|uniref:hypothetical protein n=1 Tax=Mesorhizobium sp. M0220 TaxID=2956920 RepID=UPI00333A7940